MSRSLLVALLLSLVAPLAVAEVAPAPEAVAEPPKALLAQVERLTELLRDGYAQGYADATLCQILTVDEYQQLALAVFTIEGFGGGNNHRQYFAAFRVDVDASQPPYYSLLDVIAIGGKGWRGVEELNATLDVEPERMLIRFGALEVTDQDAPNFPSKKTVVTLVLEDGQLHEQPTP